MVKVFIDNELVFEGAMGRLGGGGTKTAYALNGTDFAVLLPNEVDGEALERVFPRICHEEETFYKYLSTNNVALSLPVQTCVVTLDNGKTLFGLYTPCFDAFVQKGAFVLDQKDSRACCWDSKRCINPTFFDADSWIPIFMPFVQDLKRLANAGIVPLGDSLNFVITTPAFGESHVDPTVPFQVRFFGFDFTSKRYVSDLAQSMNCLEPGTLLKPAVEFNYLEEALDVAVDVVLSTTRQQLAEETSEDVKRLRELYVSVVRKLLESSQ